MFRLTRYGRREWRAATAVAAGGCALLAVAAWRLGPLWLVPVAAIVPAWLWATWFFRDPDRQVPGEPGLFVSPADGVVADVTPLGPDSALGTDGTQIGVFMSIFSVHVNRMPCDATVVAVQHRPGAFLDVRKPQAALRNESTTIRLTVAHGGREHPVIVRQVAGLVARRIVTDLVPGSAVRRGQRFGMIKFGSRLELLVPRELVGEVRVAVGDRAVAGRTVLLAAPKGPPDDDRAEP
ncbi:MAG TPA: phosphatidylserine decarboxylase [Phycisphaerae bacterium]|nr:phosphatidylserine decarboxylase [Phycisphaerae bacterium]